jgi:TolB-like protein/Flp pilus assembly protein TadD
MADVFCSYKREDSDRVKQLAEALQVHGLHVWWDIDLEGGSLWRHRLLEELQAARCVIVCWTRASLGPAGEFVHDEASAAKLRGVYLPVALDDVHPPLGFGQVHTLPLHKWQGDPQAPDLLAVVAAVRRFVDGDRRLADRTGERGKHPTRNESPKVAVLPFASPAGDAERADFAGALAEDLIIGLARSRLLSLLPAKTSLDFNAGSQGTRKICTALDVDYVVQGQLRPMGRRLRLSLHLSSGQPETAVWSGRFDYEADQVFDKLDEIVNSLVGAIEVALLAHEETEAFATPEPELGAWGLFVRGRAHFWRGYAADAKLASKLFERALKRQPGSAPIHTELAYTALHDLLLGIETDPAGAVRLAHQRAMQAVAADRDYGKAHCVLGITLALLGRRKEALAEQEHALKLNPALAEALGEKARLLLYEARADEALACADRALHMTPADPHAWLWQIWKAIGYFQLGNAAEALEHAISACVRRSDYYFVHDVRAVMAATQGDLDQARVAYAEARKQQGGEPNAAAIRTRVPLPDGPMLDKYLEGYRIAGSNP